MFKQYLKLIFKSRLTITIAIVLLAIDVFLSVKYAISDDYLFILADGIQIKYQGYTSYTQFYFDFSVYLFLILPLAYLFLLIHNDKFEQLESLRGNTKLVRAGAISLSSTLLFLVISIIAFTIFYSIKGFGGEPILYYENSKNPDFFLSPLFFMDHANYTYIWLWIVYLFYSLLYFLYLFTVYYIAISCPEDIRFLVYLFLVYGSFFLISKIEGPFIDIVILLDAERFTTQEFLSGYFMDMLFYVGILAIFIVIKYLFKRRNVI